MNKESIMIDFVHTVKLVEKIHFDGTYRWYLDTDDNGNDWAIVMAYMDCDGDGETLYAKVAYQPSNSIMQCDYDIDWIMPYDEETGEVWDTEVSVDSSNATSVIEWLLDNYKDMSEAA